MSAKYPLLGIMLISLSLSHANAASGTGAIGTVSARGDLRLDGYPVWGNGTLFDGTAVQTNQATATLRLDNGTEIRLAINSRGVVYRDHLVLLQGKGQLRTSDSSFQIRADGLRVAPGGPNALGVVSLRPANTVDVAAIAGKFRIVDSAGFSLAHISTGAAMSFRPAQAAGLPQGTSFNEAGMVSVDNGHFYLTGSDGVRYELVTGKDLHKFVGHKVVVTGFLQGSSTPSGSSEVLVTAITINGAKVMSSQEKIIIGGAVAGGAAVFIGVAAAESSKTPASR